MRTEFSRPESRFSSRVCLVYALVFVLMLLLDAERFSDFLDRVSLDVPPVAPVAVVVRDTAETAGFTAFSQAESRVVAALTVEATVGASGLSDRADKPSSETQRADKPGTKPGGTASVEKALAEFSDGTHPEALSPTLPAGSEKLPNSDLAVPEEPMQPPHVVPVRPAVEKPKVLLIGDSMMMEGFGPVLLRTLRKRTDMEVVKEGKYSTGLSRQDYFDWPPYLEQLITQHDPDLVVICMGANDPQDIIDENKKRHHADSESWKTIYKARAERLLAVATSRGAKVVWAGLPVMGKEPYSTRIRRLSDLQQAACATYGGVFVDTLPVLSDKGGYATFKTDSQGRHVRLRYKDMVHVTEDGGAMLTTALIPAIEKTLKLGPYADKKPASEMQTMPATPDRAGAPVMPGTFTVPAPGKPRSEGLVPSAVAAELTSVPFVVESKARGQRVPCTAFLPTERNPDERFPVLYLLHGAYENGEVWNKKVGQQLTALANQHRMVLVAPSCEATGWYADSSLLPQNRIERFMMDELVPQVERMFPVLPQRGITGMSMGGHGAVTLALRHPGVFGSISSMSGVLDITQHPSQWNISKVLGPLKANRGLWEAHSAHSLLQRMLPSQVPPLLITTGQQDSLVLAENRRFQEALRKGGFFYQYREAHGGHDWTYWKSELPQHVAFHATVLHRERG